MGAWEGSQGEKVAAEAFNIVNISETQDKFESIIGGEMTFRGAFVGR